jgi:hypothetical protein
MRKKKGPIGNEEEKRKKDLSEMKKKKRTYPK